MSTLASEAKAPAPTAAVLPRGALPGLLALTLINLFNYLDRYVVAALAESLKKAPELSLSDAKLGLLMTAFIVVYMLVSPFFGWLGDRGARTKLVAGGVAIWSLATAAAGLSRGFGGLLGARSLVGVGEAAYGTIAPSLLADYFPKSSRGRVFAVFFAAIPIGSALGYVLGGLVDQHFGWRAAFYIAGLPGLLLAGLCLLLPDPERGSQERDEDFAHGHGQSTGGLATYRVLLKNPAYSLTVLGYALYTFALGGIAAWMPAFLERERGFAHDQATVQFGAIVVVTGFLGTFAGGWLGDRLLRRTRQAYLWVSGVATLLACPACLVAFSSSDQRIELIALFIAEVLVFISTGPINSAIVNVVAPEMRSSAVALSILAIHLLGDVPSPFLIGLISDFTSLGTAVFLVPVAVLAGGIVWSLAAFLGERRGWAA